MKLSLESKPSKNAVVIFPIFEDAPSSNKGVAELVKNLGKQFEAKAGQTFFEHHGIEGVGSKVILLGLGKEKELDYTNVLESFSAATSCAKSRSTKTLFLSIEKSLVDFAQAIGEAVVMTNYNQSAPYKTGDAAEKIEEQEVEALEIGKIKKKSAPHLALQKGLLIGETSNELRDWINAPPNIANANFFDERAKEATKECGASLKIYKNKELLKMGCGAILAVNRGSPDEARMIVIDYKPWGWKKDEVVVLVGKGILFDSGGYNLKPSGHIEDMQLDKSGEATVIACARLLKKLSIKRRVVIVTAMTENLIGPHAQKPSEIIKSYSGKTIEVTNTDAEGRLVLADALAFSIDKFKPQYMVDLATLTGACMAALGFRYAGLFGNDKELSEKLRSAGDAINEDLWPLPIHKDHHEQIKGTYGDIQNTSTVRYAGASTAAAFLEQFVGKTKWAHLDIAGPAFTQTPKKYESKGATGFGLRMLIKFLEGL